jgi:hypothetical protein
VAFTPSVFYFFSVNPLKKIAIEKEKHWYFYKRFSSKAKLIFSILFNLKHYFIHLLWGKCIFSSQREVLFSQYSVLGQVDNEKKLKCWITRNPLAFDPWLMGTKLLQICSSITSGSPPLWGWRVELQVLGYLWFKAKSQFITGMFVYCKNNKEDTKWWM